MSFFISVLWVLVSFGGPWLGVGSHTVLPDRNVHHVSGGRMHVMDSNGGGPT
jgi:hypothetical protein